MSDMIDELHQKAQEYGEKYKDQGLTDYLLTLAQQLEEGELMRHHFGYFLMHAQAVLPYDVQPRHFREALARAKKVLGK
jgi:hypothetical protein